MRGSLLCTEALPLPLLPAHCLSLPHPISSLPFISLPSTISVSLMFLSVPISLPLSLFILFLQFFFFLFPTTGAHLPSCLQNELCETHSWCKGPLKLTARFTSPSICPATFLAVSYLLALQPPEYQLLHVTYMCCYTVARLKICGHCSLCPGCPFLMSLLSYFLSFYFSCRRHHSLQKPFPEVLLTLLGYWYSFVITLHQIWFIRRVVSSRVRYRSIFTSLYLA